MLTIDQAIERLREIQWDLEAGRLTVPYPLETRETLARCLERFMAHATTNEAATALVQRLSTRPFGPAA